MRNDWVIKPHRHTHLLQILCVFSGVIEVRLDDRNSSHNGSCITAILPGAVHGFRFRPGTNGVVLGLAIGMPGLKNEKLLDHQLDHALQQVCLVEAVSAGGVQLTSRFRTMLQEHYRKHWKIGD